MKNYLLFLFLLLPGCKQTNQYTKISDSIDFREFENPSKNYRAVPFWSLNDLLDSAELDRQIVEFTKGGYGGVYLHSRTGLLTEYLGKDWWKAMDAGVEACRRNNVYAWFYDEDKWPSGFAGGMVPLKSEDYHARCLMRLSKGKKVPDGATVLHEDNNWYYLSYKARSGSAWFNGTCYVDLLNPSMVKEFIESSYVPYADRYRKDFGKTALGIFTDEPQFFPITDGIDHDGVQPFSPVLINKFKQDNGYDLIPVITSLFDTIPGYEKVRIDYYRTLSRQMEASFSKQIGDFCASRNMMFTGHYNGEDGLTSVRNNVGDLMIQLRHMQQPGLDHLGLHIDGALYAIRNISSVSNQYGIPRRLSEAYGISGQNMNFEDRAWIASWHTLNGVNHLCPHLALYSMKGTRKRDYPPTLSSQQPYWQYNKLLEDYVARLCYVTTVGKYSSEFLVVNPLESEYIEGGINMKSGTRRTWHLLNLLEVLQVTHRNYDLGDEQVLSEIARVEKNKIVVGEQTYKGVILPGMLTIRKSTADLLRQFAASGGRIIATEMPLYIDGNNDPEQIKALKDIITLTDAGNFQSVLQKEVLPDVMITGENTGDVWISHRISSDKHILQVTNTSRQKTIRCKIAFRENPVNIILLDPSSGKAYTIENSEGYELLLHPAQSYILADEKLVQGYISSGAYSVPEGEKELLTISGDWTGKRLDVNAMTLDFARYSVDGGKSFSQPEPVIGIHERFTASQYNGPLILAFDFNADYIPSKCDLVIEQPEMFSAIEVNGKAVKFDGKTFYRDLTFKTVAVSDLVADGSNTVLLSLNYRAPVPESRNPFERYGSEIESIYLTGEFAIKADTSKRPAEPSQHNARGFLVSKAVHHFSSFTITEEKSLFTGDLVSQGYPFYNGSFMLEKSFEITRLEKDKKYLLKFPLSEAIIIKVKINGNDLPPVAWSPWEVDITDALKEGTNEVSITLINSLRNLLGPHHNAEGELIELSPESFTGASTWTTNRKGEADWYERRLKGDENTNIWRDDYCMIPFGLLENAVIVERAR
ncbi:MAG: hypothetical protein IPN67_14230 [Bacteroidales bacterium]|nr:hypothetical protein [Bacteroidales bacterium]